MNNGPKSPAYRFCGTDSVVLLIGGSARTTLDSVGDRVEDLSSKLLTFLVVFLSACFSPALPIASMDDCLLLLLEKLFAGSILVALVALVALAALVALVAPVEQFSPA